jgi:hypothetical protein
LYIIKQTTSFTALANTVNLLTNDVSYTVTLPASPTSGDQITIVNGNINVWTTSGNQFITTSTTNVTNAWALKSTTLISSPPADLIGGAAISSDGVKQYIAISSAPTSRIAASANSGTSWALPVSINASVITAITCDLTGTYVYATTSSPLSINMSINSGATYTGTSLAVGFNVSSMTRSSTRIYVTSSASNSPVYYYPLGSLTTGPALAGFPAGLGTGYRSISVSDNDMYILASDTAGVVKLSSDGGTTNTPLMSYGSTNVLCAISNTGKYLYVANAHNTIGNIRKSADFGVSFTTVSTGSTTIFSSITARDSYVIAVKTDNTAIYASDDYGVTWSSYANSTTPYPPFTRYVGLSSTASSGTFLASGNAGASIRFIRVPVSEAVSGTLLSGGNGSSVHLMYNSQGKWQVIWNNGTIVTQI